MGRWWSGRREGGREEGGGFRRARWVVGVDVVKAVVVCDDVVKVVSTGRLGGSEAGISGSISRARARCDGRCI